MTQASPAASKLRGKAFILGLKKQRVFPQVASAHQKPFATPIYCLYNVIYRAQQVQVTKTRHARPGIAAPRTNRSPCLVVRLVLQDVTI